MFNMFKKREITDSDHKLKQITDLLFPQFDIRISSAGDKYIVDSSADSNMDAAIADLQEGILDNTCISTLEACAQRLSQVREILNPAQIMVNGVDKYILNIDKYKLDFDQINPTETDQ